MQITTQFACCQRPTPSYASPTHQNSQTSSGISDEFVPSRQDYSPSIMEGVFWGGATATPALGGLVHLGLAADFEISEPSQTPSLIALAGATLNAAGTAALIASPFVGSMGMAKAGVALLAGSGLAGMVNHFTT